MNSAANYFAWFLMLTTVACSSPALANEEDTALFKVVDLDVSETTVVKLPDGKQHRITLHRMSEKRDTVMKAIKTISLELEIDGTRATIVSGLYRLPTIIDTVQIDCPVTVHYNRDSHINHWGLTKDARLRIWPADSPWIQPGSFVYPVGQKWFASQTWFSNEAVSRRPNGQFYYHAGLDIGGCEGEVPVFAATDGRVVSVAGQSEPNLPPSAVQPRYDVIYLQDSRGWYYRYSHLDAVRTKVRIGSTVRAGERIGTIGKEGGSGGWSHLHFEIKSLQPSGVWGTQDGYAFLWQAYKEQHKPAAIAVARPRHLAQPEEELVLDGSRSWTAGTEIHYHWILSDGSTSDEPLVKRSYVRPGTYSEQLRVTDELGHTSVDFLIVKITDPDSEMPVPGAHATYYPTLNLKVGTPITFKVRARNTTTGNDVWDFGDGSPKQTVKSNKTNDSHAPDGYAVVLHRYRKAGEYIASVTRQTSGGTAIDKLWITIDP